MIKQFLPDLVTAISDIVQPVSDQCLAKGLIPESVYKRVLESGWTSEDKARTLILAVNKSTETDSRCFKIFLSILHEQPTCKKLVSAIRKELTNISMSPSIQPFQCIFEPPHQLVSSISTDEPPIRRHSHAPTQDLVLSEMLRTKSKECDRLTDELEALKKQSQQATSDANARIRITACEQEISALKLRVEELEGTPEGQNRQSSGGLSSTIEELSVQLQKAIEEMKDIKEVFQNKRQKSGICSS